MSLNDSERPFKNLLAFTPKQMNEEKLIPRYEHKAILLKQIRDVTKPVYDQLNNYFTDIKEAAPIFGFPVISFGERKSTYSHWSLISQNVYVLNFKLFS